MAIARRLGRLHAGPGRRPAQGDRQEEQAAHGQRSRSRCSPGCAPAASRTKVNQKLWSNFEATGDYSFNKSHAACYALISYRTAWLKANYPVEYMAAARLERHEHQGQGAVLRQPVPRDGDRGAAARRQRERRRLHRRRRAHPLRAQRGQGRGQGGDRGDHRRRAPKGPYTSIYDFCGRVDSSLVNKRTLEALIKSGAFDSTGDTRRGMLEALPAAMADGERRRKDRAAGQGGLFDLLGGDGAGGADLAPPTSAAGERRIRRRRAPQVREGGARPVRLGTPAEGAAPPDARADRRHRSASSATRVTPPSCGPAA